jgi:crossover junction endodeoxyribonuclease RuvC
MGYGVVEERRGRLAHVGHGVIKVDADAPLELRLKELHDSLLTALKLYKPQAVAVEGVFTFRNARSALILGHARGVALLAAAQAGLPVHEYAPARVKRSVGAGGSADKDAVGRMVCTFLELEEIERADASDALAVALCHLNQSRAGVPVSAGKVPRSRRKSAQSQLADRLVPSYRRPEAR